MQVEKGCGGGEFVWDGSREMMEAWRFNAVGFPGGRKKAKAKAKRWLCVQRYAGHTANHTRRDLLHLQIAWLTSPSHLRLVSVW